MAFFKENSESVADLVSKLTLGQYNPVSSVEVLTPKANLGFRIGHQLTATDILIYTASVIECADGIQDLRDRTSQDVPFSYKYDANGEARLFESNRGFHDWLAYLASFGDDDVFDDAKPVLETDISDFYQRIYFHRIENILNDVNASRGSNGAIKKVIQVCRSKQSFGLPVGSSASRLLAEGLLCDTDRLLLDMGLQASRYVDDYRIIANDRNNTHSVLCRLAEHLMVTEGLSLNVAKTRIVDTRSLHKSVQQKLQDVFTTAEMRAFHQHLSTTYGDEEIDDEDESGPDNPFLTGSDLLDRLDELKKNNSDFSSRKAILKVLRSVPAADAARLLKDHRDLAYHLPRDFCRAIRASIEAGLAEPVEVEAAVWDLLQKPPISELSYARLWLLNLYANGTLPSDRKLIVNTIGRPSALEERQLIFIRARLNDRAFFREQRGRLGQVGEWIKPALLVAGACLPADEYRNWIDIAVRQLGDPFAQAFGNWLKQGQDYEALMAV
ncbi:RNA-directed DNA polymerase [Novosphingobium aerophilum]|uniref:RNA-directed DNA polymerase n=1 Tax=Novosphingobium aerophilum TaxID=2839843 RepID=A0A7X1FA94_9SPHN|nr:RNA-directed DNA polymerase [Novosphingobium aerophilum]MBC2653290.1 RNA-directed DNA polymerase [Novosphingobium aerophilum]